MAEQGQDVQMGDHAGSADSPLFSKLPLEMRYKIYDFASLRPEGAHLILKEWLERKDPNIGPPPAPTPVPASAAAPAAAVMDEGGDSEAEDNEEDEEAQEDSVRGVENEDDHMDETTSDAAEAVTVTKTITSNTASAGATAQDVEEGNEGEDNEGDDMEPEEGEVEHEDDGEENEEENEGETEDQNDDGTAAIAIASAQPPPTYGRDTKYRHILPIIKISSCPPPVNLLQTCNQVYHEALHYYLSTAIMTIDCTRGFQHVSMFTETLDLFLNHAFSPIEQVRKINLIFSWDSEWLSSKMSGSPPEIEGGFYFDYYLQERVDQVVALLQKAPSLRKLTVHWFDTENTPESESLMNEKLSGFLPLTARTWKDEDTGLETPVELKITDHFSAAGTSHPNNTVLAVRRAEFDQILSRGLGMAFR